ncbi:MAG: GGDEF domain-containing protein, partial [Lachnospiraceae bacterium]|nr:GGDEF domain-containing protein [Lachnospiraceae bacterium]
MTYSTVSILALILNIVINPEVFVRYGIRSGIREIGQRAVDRYRWFLVASNCYFIADIAWGLLYERHDVPGLFPVLYIDCVLYFLFMFMTMLTWMRYVVAYLNKTGNRSKALLYVVWIMFSLAIVYLVINYF